MVEMSIFAVLLSFVVAALAIIFKNKKTKID